MDYTSNLYFMIAYIPVFKRDLLEQGALRHTCKALAGVMPPLTMKDVLENHTWAEVLERAKHFEQQCELTFWSEKTPFDAFRKCAQNTGEVLKCDFNLCTSVSPMWIAHIYEHFPEGMDEDQFRMLLQYIPDVCVRMVSEKSNSSWMLNAYGRAIARNPEFMEKISSLNFENVEYVFVGYFKYIILNHKGCKVSEFKKLLSLTDRMTKDKRTHCCSFVMRYYYPSVLQKIQPLIDILKN